MAAWPQRYESNGMRAKREFQLDSRNGAKATKALQDQEPE